MMTKIQDVIFAVCFCLLFLLLTACTSQDTTLRISDHQTPTGLVPNTDTPVNPSTTIAAESPDDHVAVGVEILYISTNPVDSAFDLDEASSVLRNADINFEMNKSGEEQEMHLQPINGAMVAPLSRTQPSIQECQRQRDEYIPKSEEALKEGAYICVFSNSGRFGWIKIKEIGLFGEGSLKIEYHVWQETFPDFSEFFHMMYPHTTPSAVAISPEPQSTTLPNSTSTIHDIGTMRLSTEYASNNPNSFANFDFNETEDDIRFVVDRGGGGNYTFFLLPLNGSTGVLVTNSQPELDDCYSKLTSEDAFPETGIFDFSVGDYLCLITSQGHIVRLHLDDMNLNEGWIQLSFLVWD